MGEDLHVAVVEDDEALCRSLGRLLRAAGLRVVTYPSSEALLADPRRFDCLLLDVQLPGLSGIELAERLAGAGSTAPVVFLTAHDDAQTRAQALRIPRTTFLTKTEPAETLLAAIRGAAQSKDGSVNREEVG